MRLAQHVVRWARSWIVVLRVTCGVKTFVAELVDVGFYLNMRAFDFETRLAVATIISGSDEVFPIFVAHVLGDLGFNG